MMPSLSPLLKKLIIWNPEKRFLIGGDIGNQTDKATQRDRTCNWDWTKKSSSSLEFRNDAGLTFSLPRKKRDPVFEFDFLPKSSPYFCQCRQLRDGSEESSYGTTNPRVWDFSRGKWLNFRNFRTLLEPQTSPRQSNFAFGFSVKNISSPWANDIYI